MDLVNITLFDKTFLQISSDLIFVSITSLSIILFIAYKLITKKQFSEVVIDEAELGIGNLKFKIKSNSDVAQIAYNLWVELSTRKIGLEVDPDYDVIEEVYNSWYSFFGITRELIKQIPANSINRNKDTEKLIRIATDVLNKEFRTHLTKWQAKFRYWYERQKQENKNILFSPQQIQKEYPHFDELIKDMQDVNKKMIYYKQKLEELFSCSKVGLTEEEKTLDD